LWYKEPISIIKPEKILKNRILDLAIEKQHVQLADSFFVSAIDYPSNFHKRYSDLVATALSGAGGTTFANEKLKIFLFDKFLTMRSRSSCHNGQDGVILSTAKIK
jgi:hypothetical protein